MKTIKKFFKMLFWTVTILSLISLGIWLAIIHDDQIHKWLSN